MGRECSRGAHPGPPPARARRAMSPWATGIIPGGRRRRGGKGKRGETLSVVFCNITSLSKAAKAFLLDDASQVVLAVEMHLNAWQELQASQRFRHKGWKTFWATAEESHSSEAGTWGGAFAAVRHFF